VLDSFMLTHLDEDIIEVCITAVPS
jgi:hypothetical protein